MPSPTLRVRTAEKEAAAWHARLGAPHVATDTLEAFFTWRARPENAEAYRRVERVWGAQRALSADPAIRAATDAALDRARPTGSGRVRFVLAGAAAALTVVLGVWGVVWLGGRDVYATGVGEQRVVRLSDGSILQLDTASRARVRYGDARRLVELEAGQAMFTVAREARRPFVVRADGAEVTAIGTVFDVRRRDGGAEVVLVSGMVDVAPRTGAKVRLAAGQRAVVAGRTASAAPADVRAATSWTQGRLTFQDTPLEVAVAEVNRYLTQGVSLEADDLAEVRIDGVFRIGDREAFVSAVADLYDLSVARPSDGTVRLTPRKK